MAAKISDLVSVSLERTYRGDKGFEFENFCQNLCRCQLGNGFFSTSPFKDGGIDGFLTRIDEEMVITPSGKPSNIFQFGTTELYSNKIKETVETLRAKSIDVKKITYYSPRSISNITKVINELEEELDIAINLIDHSQICTMAGAGECQTVFKDFIASMIGEIESVKDSKITYDYPVIYLNTWYRYEQTKEHNDAIKRMTKSLIIWSLRETDPEKNIFLQESEIRSSIEKTFPAAKKAIESIFMESLNELCKERTEHGRKVVQKHKDFYYCLPFETRNEYETRDEESKEILLLVKDSFSTRLTEFCKNDERRKALSELMIYTVKNLFTEKGMRFVEFLKNQETDNYEEIYLLDSSKKASKELSRFNFQDKEIRSASIALRRVFAKPNKHEQEYLIRSSHLYVMHYIMHNDIGVISFFEERTKRLTLLVHSDVLIRALSEAYLPIQGMHYTNLLNYLRKTGATLLMTEEALTEVYKNLRIATYEYQNYIQGFENDFSLDSIKFLPVLMVRAYLYSHREGKVKSWERFINTFCTPSSLHSDDGKAKDELNIFLADKFGLSILRTEEIERDTKQDLSKELTELIKPYKKKDEIAKHVANVNLYISYIRQKHNEISSGAFGYKTYWLTHERTVYSIAKEFFDRHKLGNRLVMRPEFIMQQTMFSLDRQTIERSYSETFPTALGVQMSQQLDAKNFHLLMEKLNEMSQLDPSRAKAIVNEAIQVASEETTLSEGMEYYDHWVTNGNNGNEKGCSSDEASHDLREKIERIIKRAEMQVKQSSP